MMRFRDAAWYLTDNHNGRRIAGPFFTNASREQELPADHWQLMTALLAYSCRDLLSEAEAEFVCDFNSQPSRKQIDRRSSCSSKSSWQPMIRSSTSPLPSP
jgi:hypothetical protein